MQRNLSIVVRLATCSILALGFLAQAQDIIKRAVEDKKVDPTGTWKWSYTTGGGQTRESTATFKLEGDKLTGTLAGRSGDIPITSATLKGDEIAFTVVREFGGNSVTNKYAGKIAGDTIKGKIEYTRNGEAQSRDWDAKREAAAPKETPKDAPKASPAK